MWKGSRPSSSRPRRRTLPLALHVAHHRPHRGRAADAVAAEQADDLALADVAGRRRAGCGSCRTRRAGRAPQACRLPRPGRPPGRGRPPAPRHWRGWPPGRRWPPARRAPAPRCGRPGRRRRCMSCSTITSVRPSLTLADQLHRALGLRAAHAGGRLVEQDHLGAAGHRHADLQRALLGVRQRAGRHVGPCRQADLLDHLVGALIDPAQPREAAPERVSVAAGPQQRAGHVVERRQAREQVGDLEAARQPEAADLVRRQPADTAAAQQHLAAASAACGPRSG